MRLALICACAVWATFCGVLPGHAEKRVALVIGNGDYQHADKLANPVTDARRVRDALTKLNFDIVYGEDLDQQSLRRTVGRFASVVHDSDVALVFFAGHGATFGDIPYVVPVDARFSKLEEVPYDLVTVETLIGELRQAKGVRIAILDACRDNTAERELKRVGVAARGGEITRGLARVRNPEGLILAYATQYLSTAADGDPRGDSPFTAALLANVATPGLDVKDLFFKVGREVIASTKGAQRPEISVSFYDSYSLVPAVAPNPPSAAVSPQDQAAEVWRVTHDTTSQAVLEAFIRRFGDSPYVDLARARLDELKRSETAVVVAAPPAAAGTPVTECDRLAADRADLQRPADVAGPDMGWFLPPPPGAGQACRDAVERFPNEPRFKYQLGRVMQFTSSDSSEAVQWHRKAAESGYTAAMKSLAVSYWYGFGVSKDEAEAMRWYRKAAEAGDGPGMYQLAHHYEKGEGIGRDDAEAARWYRKAAEAGDVSGMISVAEMYDEGRGIGRDFAEAMRWSRKAADAGSISGMRLIGRMYELGHGVGRDDAEAARWHRKAAEAGNTDSMLWLAQAYQMGRGLVGRDDAEAVGWYRKAAEAGVKASQMWLAEAYEVGRKPIRRDADQAAYWLLRALRSGGNSSTKTSLVEQRGNGHPIDVRKAIQRQLHADGKFNGKIDGRFGDDTIKVFEELAKPLVPAFV